MAMSDEDFEELLNHYLKVFNISLKIREAEIFDLYLNGNFFPRDAKKHVANNLMKIVRNGTNDRKFKLIDVKPPEIEGYDEETDGYESDYEEKFDGFVLFKYNSKFILMMMEGSETIHYGNSLKISIYGDDDVYSLVSLPKLPNVDDLPIYLQVRYRYVCTINKFFIKDVGKIIWDYANIWN
jgi:hypothetical protein